MNSFTSISFVVLFLFQGIAPDLSRELQKIPNLMEHYEEHKICNDGSFLQFLLDDYLNLDGDAENDHHRDTDHGNLPFHGSHQCCHSSVFCTSDQHFSLVAFQFDAQVEFGYNNSFHTSDFLDSPFQPPRG